MKENMSEAKHDYEWLKNYPNFSLVERNGFVEMRYNNMIIQVFSRQSKMEITESFLKEKVEERSGNEGNFLDSLLS